MKRWAFAAAGVAVMVAGVLGAVVAGRTLSEQAYTAWSTKADSQVRALTQYFDDLMLDARTVVRALSAQVSRDETITPFMFRTTLELAQDPDAMFRMQEAAFVQRASRERRVAVEEQVGRVLHQVGNGAADAPDAYEHFAVVVATDDARMLTVGADLGTEPALRAAVATAYRRPNEVIASPVFERGGEQWLALAERPVFPGQRNQTGMVVTLIDFGAVVAHVRDMTPPGIHLYMTQRETDWDPVAHIEDVTTAPADAAAAVERMEFRLVHGQARLSLEWFVFDSYLGGPATALGTVVMLAGTALTLLLGTLVAVLALQNDSIRQRVKVRTRQAEAARDEAEIANRYKSEFLASVSHELRTPLNAIIGFSEVIMREMKGPLGQPRYKDYAQDIHVSGRHLLGVINSIIDLSAIESGQLVLNEEPVALPQVFDNATRIIALQADKRGVALTCDIPAAMPRLLADRIAIEQILLNLGANAVQFTPRGGTVTFACGQTGDAIWLTVTDTGVGMDPAEVARAMQPFGQVVSPLRRVSDGAGLGLPIAKELATRHGGAFEVDSRPGNGTRIRILFDSSRTLKPAAEAAQAVA